MRFSIIRQILSPILILRVLLIKNTYWGKLYLKHRTSNFFYKKFHKKLNWKHPNDFNEKINWLKFNSNTSLWTELADKYKVREYMRKKGFENLLVTLYGVWEDANDINFENLPGSFVLKTNNSCGKNIIVENKIEINEKEVRRQLNDWIKLSKRTLSLEPHYFKIKPKIIAEEYLSPEKQVIKSCSLIDYKIWCFNGKPNVIFVCTDRTTSGKTVALYDLNWKPVNIFISKKYSKTIINGVPKPKSLDTMLNVCEILAKDFPQVRMDFYEVDGKPYFGEMTFTAKGGFMDVFSQDYLVSMGEKIDLTLTKNGK